MVLDKISEVPVQLWWIAGGSFLLLLSLIFIIPIIIIKIPSDYFAEREYPSPLKGLRFPLNLILIIIKNAAGLIFVIGGFILLFVPGQGLLTLFTGFMLMNFPGKRRLELFIVRKKPVLRAVNWIRNKAGQELIGKIYRTKNELL